MSNKYYTSYKNQVEYAPVIEQGTIHNTLDMTSSFAASITSGISNIKKTFTQSNNTIKFDFQKLVPLEKRITESGRIKYKYPDRYAVICEVLEQQRNELKLDKSKYLVPADITIGQFIYIIRKRIKLKQDQALFLFTEDSQLPATSNLVSQIYEQHKNEDGFLYFLISGESTFGNVCEYC